MYFKLFLPFVFLLLSSLNVYGYEIISSKTTVSPGCEGGVLKQTTEKLLVSDEIKRRMRDEEDINYPMKDEENINYPMRDVDDINYPMRDVDDINYPMKDVNDINCMRNVGNINCRMGYVSISTDARAYMATGRVGGLINLTSHHGFTIYNDDDIEKSFRVEIKLVSHEGRFTNQERTIRLGPHDSVRDSSYLYLTNEYLQLGCHKIYAYTTVSGGGYSAATDSNTVTIRER
jgi:hypothetical protein